MTENNNMGCSLEQLEVSTIIEDKETQLLNSLFNTKHGKKYKTYACVNTCFSKGYNYNNDYSNVDYKYVNLHTQRRYNYIAIDLDIDVDLYSTIDNSKLPLPNVIIQSNKSKHFHLIYCLETPIYKYGNKGPLELFNDVKSCLTFLLKGDTSYNNGYIYNPYNKQDYVTSIMNSTPYTLSDFTDYLGVNIKKSNSIEEIDSDEYDVYPIGMRNSLLFSAIRKYAYSNWVNSHKSNFNLLDRIIELGLQLNETKCELPLKHKDIIHICKSIDYFISRKFSKKAYTKWIEINYSSERQSFRGKLKGKKKRDQCVDIIVNMLNSNKPIVAKHLMEEFNTSLKTIYNWIKLAKLELVNTNKLSLESSMNIYKVENSSIFHRVKNKNGLFSNMSQSKIVYQGYEFATSEHLYQSLRYDNLEILNHININTNPMDAKKTAYLYLDECKPDWLDINIDIMLKVLILKAQQNIEFYNLLHESKENIVELSYRDTFWGAKPNDSKTVLIGHNKLGLCLKLVRQLGKTVYSVNVEDMFTCLPTSRTLSL